MNIGESIQEAIDWTQDFLKTTRPLAEQTLFSLMAKHAVRETNEGFVLIEASGEDEIERHFKNIKSNLTKNRKHRFHTHRKKPKITKKMKTDNNDAANDMMTADENESEETL